MRLRGATSAAAAKTTTITRTPFLECDGGEVVVASESGWWDTPVRRSRSAAVESVCVVGWIAHSERRGTVCECAYRRVRRRNV